MFLLKNGFVVDPENGIYGNVDILINDNGFIEKISENLSVDDNVKVYDLEGKTVFPGFIDMHVHLREPGREDKETIESGLASAVAGGYVGVAPMPNTYPVCDNRVVVEYIKQKAKEAGTAKIFPVGATSKGQKGCELAEIGEMFESGIVAITDDGRPVTNSLLMRRAFEYIRKFDIPFMAHSEDELLAKGASMNEGEYSIRLGLKGMPNIAEAIMVERDILLAEYTKSRLHVSHVSTEESVRAIKAAKERGVKVTVELTPHHFSLNESEVEKQEYNTNTKMNPPLRNEKDRLKMIEYVKNGTIDMISTDHAPHTKVDKEVEFDYAPFGIVGLETAVALVVTKLLKDNHIDLNRMAELMSINARKIFKIEGGIKEGKKADITVVDLDKKWIVDADKFYTKGRNTPFDGCELTGKPYMTIVEGFVVMLDGKVSKRGK